VDWRVENEGDLRMHVPESAIGRAVWSLEVRTGNLLLAAYELDQLQSIWRDVLQGDPLSSAGGNSFAAESLAT